MTIRVFQSTDFGAPQLRQGNDDERHLDIFDAILVDGYGDQTITITQAGGLATITFPLGHTFDGMFKRPNIKYFISGADQAEYNGEQELTITDGTHCTFSVDGAAVSPATGVITGKVGGAGWTRPHAAVSGKRSYLQGAGSSGFSLFLNNLSRGINKTEACMYESMSATDVGVDRIGSNVSTHDFMWSDADVVPKEWGVIADETFVLFFSLHGSYHKISYFGDLKKANVADLYACLSCPTSGAGVSTAAPNFGQLATSAGASGANEIRLARGHDGLVKNPKCVKIANTSLSSALMGGSGLAYNTAYDPSLHLSKIKIIAEKVIRGELKGCYNILHNNPFDNLSTFDGNGDLSGQLLLTIGIHSVSTTPTTNAFIINLTDSY